MTLFHLQTTNRSVFCGQRANASLTLRFVATHMEWAAMLMWAFGCRWCIAVLERSVANARPIR